MRVCIDTTILIDILKDEFRNFQEKLYVALERGTIDGVLTSLDSYYRYSMDEVAKHYLYNKKQWQPHPVLITVNLDSWNSLSEQDRDTISAIGKEASDMENKMNLDYWDTCMRGMKERSQAVFTKMTDEELFAWSKLPAVQAL